MPILEERMFTPSGQTMLWPKTPRLSNLKARWRTLAGNIADYAWHRYDHDRKRGVFLALKDGRMLILILGSAGALAHTRAPVSEMPLAAH